MKTKLLTAIVLVLGITAIWLFTGGFLWGNPVEVSSTSFLMDSKVTFKIYARNRSEGERLIAQALEEGRRIEQILEPRKGEGELQKINSDTSLNWRRISPDLKTVLDHCIRFNALTDGVFDPTIAEVKWLWNFEDGAALPDEDSIIEKLRSVGMKHVHLRGDSILIDNPETKLDLGGIAQGYAADKMLALIKDGGASAALVDVSGDITFYGKKPGNKDWVIGIRHPRMNKTLVPAHIPLPVVVTSGDYERYFMQNGVRYHHILDPETGYPANNSISVTVWADSAIVADALSTAMFILGPEKSIALAERMDNVEVLIFWEENGLVRSAISSGLQGKLTL